MAIWRNDFLDLCWNTLILAILYNSGTYYEKETELKITLGKLHHILESSIPQSVKNTRICYCWDWVFFGRYNNSKRSRSQKIIDSGRFRKNLILQTSCVDLARCSGRGSTVSYKLDFPYSIKPFTFIESLHFS